MAKYSCINHPEKDYFLMLRNWQIEFCEGNKVAAGLLSILEYWYNIKYAQQQQKPEENREIKDLLQFHSEAELIDKMLSLTHTPANVRKSINFLEKKKVISIYRNPSKRYAYDRTRHFLLHPEVINQWLTEQYTQEKSKENQDVINNIPYGKKGGDNTVISPEMQTVKNIASLPTPNQQQVISPPAADIFLKNKENEEQKIKSSLVLFSLLQDLPLKEHIETSNILESLHNPALYQAIFDEWHHALTQGNVKNKFAYLAALVKRANQGKFNPTQSQHQQTNQKITEIIGVNRAKPRSEQAHNIFPSYEAWQNIQQTLSENIQKSDYMNFILPTRAYESDKAIFIRCPNVYSHNFMKSNLDKITELVGKTVLIYLG